MVLTGFIVLKTCEPTAPIAFILFGTISITIMPTASTVDRVLDILPTATGTLGISIFPELPSTVPLVSRRVLLAPRSHDSLNHALSLSINKTMNAFSRSSVVFRHVSPGKRLVEVQTLQERAPRSPVEGFHRAHQKKDLTVLTNLKS
jgi:hypothetical protein